MIVMIFNSIYRTNFS